MLEKKGIPIDLKIGNEVRVRRSWCSPLGGRAGVVSAIEPNDPYGTYLVQFEDGLQFRYERQDLELIVAPCTFPESRKLRSRCPALNDCGQAAGAGDSPGMRHTPQRIREAQTGHASP